MMDVIEIDIHNISQGYNPRTNFNIDELKQSIKEKGVLVPILVRPKDKKYEIVSGECRWRSCKELNILTIPASIRELTDEEAANISFIDNKQRNQLNPIEEAKHYAFMKEKFGYSAQDMAKQYSLSKAGIVQLLRINELPDAVTRVTDSLDKRHLYEISKLLNKSNLKDKFEDLFGPEEKWTEEQKKRVNEEIGYREKSQIDLAKRIIEDDKTVRQTERIVKDILEEFKERDKKLDKEIEEQKKLESILDGIHFKDSSDMNEVEDDSVQLIVTSPPYFVGKEYEKDITFKDHLQNLYGFLNECCKKVQPGGKIVYNVGDIVAWSKWNDEKWPEEKLIMPYITDYLRKKNFVLFARIIWEKDEPWVNSPHVSYNDETEHAEYRVLPNWEYVFVYKNMNGKPKKRLQTEENSNLIGKDMHKEYANAVWKIRSVQANNGHPAMFPEELVDRIIRMYSYKGDVVLDPYLGSGTTVKSARKLGRIGVGYEREEKYKDIIIEKLKEVDFVHITQSVETENADRVESSGSESRSLTNREGIE